MPPAPAPPKVYTRIGTTPIADAMASSADPLATKAEGVAAALQAVGYPLVVQDGAITATVISPEPQSQADAYGFLFSVTVGGNAVSADPRLVVVNLPLDVYSGSTVTEDPVAVIKLTVSEVARELAAR